MRTALVTGSSGFIGASVCHDLLSQGWNVIGLDSMNDYYDPALKQARLDRLTPNPNFTHITGKVETPNLLMDLFAKHKPDTVVHLAAQAGVRYSIENPRAYFEANMAGTFELLEAARQHPPKHMLLASTSSAYGANEAMPYKEDVKADHQMSFYAATKKSTENMAHAYAHINKLPITMFRFFTVYGPWGRPDMAPILFAKAILSDQPINVFNHGNMRRDFTYIDDLTKAIRLLIDAVPSTQILGDSLSPVAPYRVVNIGNSQPVQLLDFIAAMEASLGKAAHKNLMDIQPGDVPATWADTALLKSLTGYVPNTDIQTGVTKFIDWYKDFYQTTGKTPQ